MPDPIIIRLPGPPRGKGRHRSRVVTVPGRAPRTQQYSDAATRAYEAELRKAATATMRGLPQLTGPLSVAVYAYMPIPKSFSKKKRAEALAGLVRPEVKPDWDNIAKCSDAFNGIVWGDDASVVEGFVRKAYAETPALVFRIEPAAPLAQDLAS